MAFVEDMAVFFDVDEFAMSSTYIPADGSPTYTVECLVDHNVSRMGFDTSLVMYHTEIRFRRDQVTLPKQGDKVAIPMTTDGLLNTTTYTVRGMVTDDQNTVVVVVDD